jgi:diacylglycerol kinase family enzyme
VRALLVHNPNATKTTAALTARIARVLASHLKLEVAATKRRDHASFLAADAVHEGYEAVVALGGDGTVNEVMQGLAHTDVKLAIVPGGSTNVWARSLGLPNNALAAAGVVLDKLRGGKDRRVNLGAANGRYFGFSAGFGYDAEVVRAVERRWRVKRRVRQATFLYCGLLACLRRAPSTHTDISVRADADDPVSGLKSVVCCNSCPYTFLGPRPAVLCPDADLDAGLDLTALARLDPPSITRRVHGSDIALGALAGRRPGLARPRVLPAVSSSTPASAGTTSATPPRSSSAACRARSRLWPEARPWPAARTSPEARPGPVAPHIT